MALYNRTESWSLDIIKRRDELRKKREVEQETFLNNNFNAELTVLFLSKKYKNLTERYDLNRAPVNVIKVLWSMYFRQTDWKIIYPGRDVPSLTSGFVGLMYLGRDFNYEECIGYTGSSPYDRRTLKIKSNLNIDSNYLSIIHQGFREITGKSLTLPSRWGR